MFESVMYIQAILNLWLGYILKFDKSTIWNLKCIFP